ncbi:hypothetical protein I203_106604 [Kwoniella mangroviensis CBS 8507]|uniref:uncharacterized protein n=1 Tax=Kwoniella mangroviensis CBS 8507 TaxID=1296122 RepID=UPI00080CEA5A|nr:uncharacterized protein I203_06899 [Kwoniella mangroviensis CBS 8507]OCF63943.1 hypothetical protein I203_06899 [Kwoniella mangroviensis CBS 8507]
MTVRGGPGRGRGRGLVPPRAIEDRDVLGFANKTVANSGPPQIQTYSKPKLPPNLPTRGGRGRGARGVPSVRGGPSSSRGGLPPALRTGPAPGPSTSRGRGGYADTYRPHVPLRELLHRTKEQSRSGEWADYRDKQKERERDREEDMWNGPSRSYANGRSDTYRPSSPSALSSSRNVRRYSPSQPALQDSWSPASTPRSTSNGNGNDRFHELSTSTSTSNNHAGPSGSSSSNLAKSDVPRNHLQSNLSTNTNTNTGNGQHIIFSSPSLPPATPSIPPDPAFKRPPPSGPSASRQLSPALPPSSSTITNQLPDKGKSKAASAPTSTLQVPEPVPEIRKMSFKPINPNNPRAKGKEKQKDDSPVTAPASVRIKAEPDPQPPNAAAPIPSSCTSTSTKVREEEVDVKPRIKELERDAEVVHTGGEGIRRSGTFAFSKAELPDCWAKNPTERSKARMAFRKTQREAMIAQGKKIGGTHWRDDGVAFDWTLPDPNSDQQSGKAKTGLVDGGEGTHTASGSTVPPMAAPGSATTPAIVSPSVLDPTVETPISTLRNDPAVANASGSSRIMTAIPSSSTQIGQTTLTSAGLSKAKTNTTATNLPKTPSKATEKLVVLTPSSLATSKNVSSSNRTGASASTSAGTDDFPRSESHQIPYPPQFDTFQKRKDNSVDFNRWKVELEESFCQRDAEARPTKACTFKDSYACIKVTVYPLPQPETVKQNERTVEKKHVQSWKNREFSHYEIFDFPKDLVERERSGDKKSMKDWINKIIAIVSEPDGQGRPTRWVKFMKREDHQDLMILWKDKTQSEIDEYEGKQVTIDQDLVATLKRSEQVNEIGTKAPPMNKAEQETKRKSVSREAVPLTDKQKKKLEKQERKRAREEAASEAGSTSVVEISPAKSTSERPLKKNKNKHASADGSPSKNAIASGGGSNSLPTQHENTTNHAPEASLLLPDLPNLPATAGPSHPTPLIEQDQKPSVTSAKLEELNYSLRQKVSEIEKWTKLSNEFPDLKLALNTQIEKTREEIFKLYDDIAEEKVRLAG